MLFDEEYFLKIYEQSFLQKINKEKLHLYQLQPADELAKKEIPKDRIYLFKILNENFQKLNTKDKFLLQLKMFFKILNKLSTADPTDHFRIDFQKNEILKLK